MSDCTCEPCRRHAEFVERDPEADLWRRRFGGNAVDAVLGLIDGARDRLIERDETIASLEERIACLEARPHARPVGDY